MSELSFRQIHSCANRHEGVDEERMEGNRGAEMDDDRHDLLYRTAQRPFRFGVSAWTGNSRSEWVNKAKKVEDLGYSTLLVGDHLVGTD